MTESLLYVLRAAVVEADIVLSSGERSTWYIDLRRISLSGTHGPRLGAALSDLTEDMDFAAVGGLTLGADPVALVLAHSSPRVVDAFIVRKERKRHGLGKRVEGPSIAGRRVLVVEDVSTTGTSALEAVSAAREEGAEVVGVVAVLDRGGRAAIEDVGLEFRALFHANDVSR